MQRGVIPEEDTPHVGDIWRIDLPFGDEYKTFHYLLISEPGPDDYFFPVDGLTFDMLQLETSETVRLYMNFELDDWRKVA